MTGAESALGEAFTRRSTKQASKSWRSRSTVPTALLRDVDYSVYQAVVLPASVVGDASTFSLHVNGHIDTRTSGHFSSLVAEK